VDWPQEPAAEIKHHKNNRTNRTTERILTFSFTCCSDHKLTLITFKLKTDDYDVIFI